MSVYIDKKFIGLVSPRLQKFSRCRDHLYTFRCPYCGDSKKNPNKTRGYFYKVKNDMFFKCHNCGVGRTMYNFLKDIEPTLCSEYAMERYRNGENGNCNYPKPKEEDIFQKVREQCAVKHDLLSGIDSIRDLSAEHYARQYIENRQIPSRFFDVLYFVEDFKSFIDKVQPDNEYKLKPQDPRILIPFFDKLGEVIAVQGRALVDNKVRYITIKIKQNAPKIFGLDRVDETKRTYIVEGPIDSLFLPNSVAAAGSDLPKMFIDPVYIYDNEPHNAEVTKKIGKLVKLNVNVVIWPTGLEQKDINDMVLFGMSPEEIKEMIDQNTYSGLRAQLKFNSWRKA